MSHELGTCKADTDQLSQGNSRVAHFRSSAKQSKHVAGQAQLVVLWDNLPTEVDLSTFLSGGRILLHSPG